MSGHQSNHAALLAQLAVNLVKERYCQSVSQRYLAVAGKFLHYLLTQNIPIVAVQPEHVSKYLQCELKRFRHNRKHGPTSIDGWRFSHTTGIHHLLRMVNGSWPPVTLNPSLRTPFAELVTAYSQWLGAERGLAESTIAGLSAECARFLSWYGERTHVDTLVEMNLADIDDYFRARAPLLRRVSRKGISQRLRCFMRFAHATGRTTRDFALGILSPTLYADEGIPSVLRPDEIDAVLKFTRKDLSPIGLRDYAILMLLSEYGLRAGEVVHLRLDDIDWRGDKFLVRHTKTNAQSYLPLLPAVGEALLAYLRRGRPETESRAIFIRSRAPYRGFRDGSSLYMPIRKRLEDAGIKPVGKRGPHTFRHARAVSLLRAEVSLKVIGDVLGHQSSNSTKPYLKPATDDLRAVALDIPGRENRS